MDQNPSKMMKSIKNLMDFVLFNHLIDILPKMDQNPSDLTQNWTK